MFSKSKTAFPISRFMKKLILFCLLAWLPFALSAQSSVRKFCKKYKKTEDAVSLVVPGFVMGMGASFARKEVDQNNKKAMMGFEFAKQIKSLRMLVVEDANPVSKEDYNALIEKLQKKNKFDELITVREGNTKVNMFIRDKRKHISNLMIVVSEEDEFVLISLKTKFKYKDLKKFVRLLLQDDKKIKVVPKNPEKAVEKVIPRA